LGNHRRGETRIMTEECKTWLLGEWNENFTQGKLPPMTKQEIEDAAEWLIANKYPAPADCPGRSGAPSSCGCPEFRPACLILKVCRLAQGMASITGIARCTTCPRTFNLNTEFRDELSRKEFKISGMCQVCQDSVFVAPVEEEPDPCETCHKKRPESCKECQL
jgi:hypothetical protein